MEEKILKSGIDILGDVAWGTHFCQFYHTREDLIDILVPYFKAGLENNEFCMWITSKPFSEKEAKKAMRTAVPNFDGYLKRGQIEIIPYEEWYLNEGTFNLQRVLNGWIEKHDQALAQDYDGLRLTGNTFWLEEKDWRNFAEYEEKINNVIGKYRMMAICSYSLDKCGASEVIDVTSNHQFALIRREGKWNLIESSERKKGEEALRESEQRYRAFFEQAPDSILFVDAETGELVEFNDKAHENLGYTRQEFEKLKIPDFEIIESHEEVAKHIEKIVKEGADKFNTKHRTRSGEIRDILVSSKAISVHGRNFVQSICRDITERKQAEEALRKSEEHYRELADSISDVFFEMDKDLRYTYWNRASEKLSGVSAKDAIGKSLYKLFPDVKGTKLDKKYLEVLRTQKSQTFVNEYQLRDKNFFFEISAYPSKTGLSVFVKDITERELAEETLRESEERYRELVEKADIAILMDDKKGNFKYFNKKFADLLGYSVEEMKKQSIQSIVHPEDVDRVMKFHEERLRGKKVPSRYEFKGVRKDGSTAHLEVDADKLKERESIVGARSYLWDITERKQAEEELREKEEFNFALFQHNPIQTIVVDREGRVVKVNTAKRKSGDRLPRIGDVMYKDYAAKHEIDMHAELMECLRSDKTKRFPELKYGDKFLNILIAPFPQGAIITSLDITERKRAEDALRESEERYRAIFDQAADSIVLVDGETGDLVEFNEKAYENLGYTRKEFKKLKIPDFEIIESAEKVAKHIKKIIRDGSDMFETKHRTKGGEILDILVSSRAISIEGRDFIQSIWSDITERKRAEEEIKNSQSQLRNLTAHLQSVREEERTLIAREMHDELGQALTAMKMDLSWLDKRLPKDQKPLLKKTKSMSKLADATLQTVKKISTELRPELLDDLGLPAAIEWQAEEFQTRTGIKCEITVDPEDITLDKDRSTAIFRIFQETLTNVTRHAKATKVKVSLREKASKIELKVRDNGKGITEEQTSNPKSFGLIGIKERAYYLGGNVVIKGLQDKGTTLTIRIPLPKKGKTK